VGLRRRDRAIVADVVAEWARRHGKPFVLDLTGPAGSTYAHDPDLPEAQHLSLDAVEFCRTLAGREHAIGLLTTIVPLRTALRVALLGWATTDPRGELHHGQFIQRCTGY
jgi:hypothetical protein